MTLLSNSRNDVQSTLSLTLNPVCTPRDKKQMFWAVICTRACLIPIALLSSLFMDQSGMDIETTSDQPVYMPGMSCHQFGIRGS